MAFFSAVIGGLATFANFSEKELNATRGMSRSEKQEKRSEGFYQIPRRDPYAARWAEIQARESQE
jgi:hypothetical protein